MTSYEEAVAIVLRYVEAMPAEDRPLPGCLGQVTAEDMRSGLSLPQTSIAGPDGYAVRSADIAGASREAPAILRVGETVRAGRIPRREVKAGTAARVMTGSVFPRGADCVVRFEDTDEPPDKNGPNRNRPKRVRVYVAEKAGANLRRAGSAVKRSALVVPKGTVIGPAQISALTAIGTTSLKVIRRPVVAVIATGDELVSTGKPLIPGRTYNSNTAALVALVTHYGGIPKVLGIARDRQESLRLKLSCGLAAADAILTSGGVSKGDFDLVRLVLGTMGKVLFSRIRLGPGVAFSFGMLGRESSAGKSVPVPVFALSGPSAGCMINFEALVRPALLRMLGHTSLRHPEVEAIALDAAAVKRPLPFVLWTKLEQVEGRYRVTLNEANGPGFLPQLASANSFTILPEKSTIDPGDKVRVWPLSWSS
jgi:molybdopterin molybdotransferase